MTPKFSTNRIIDVFCHRLFCSMLGISSVTRSMQYSECWRWLPIYSSFPIGWSFEEMPNDCQIRLVKKGFDLKVNNDQRLTQLNTHNVFYVHDGSILWLLKENSLTSACLPTGRKMKKFPNGEMEIVKGLRDCDAVIFVNSNQTVATWVNVVQITEPNIREIRIKTKSIVNPNFYWTIRIFGMEDIDVIHFFL